LQEEKAMTDYHFGDFDNAAWFREDETTASYTRPQHAFAAKEPVQPDTPMPLPPEAPPDVPLEIPQELPDTDAPDHDLPDPATA
jgi:hypothetical protein